MNAMRSEKKAALLACVLVFASGCGGTQLQVESIPASENPSEQIDRLFRAVDEARKNHVDVLAPTWFARAEASLDEATKLRNRGDDIAQILQSVAEGLAQVKKAEEVSKVATSALPNAIKARDDARTAGATSFEKDYGKTEAKFLELARAIEKNDLKWATENEASVVEEFRALELRAIKHQALSGVQGMIQLAKSDGAAKMAPRTLALAEQKVAEADAFVTRHRYEKEGIEEKVQDAKFAANRLLQVLQMSKRLEEMKPEDTALWTEDLVADISTTVSSEDWRDQSLSVQADRTKVAIVALQQDNRSLVERLAAKETELVEQEKAQQAQLSERERAIRAEREQLEQQIAALQGRTQAEREERARLEAEREFLELYDQVSTYFDPSEAEVYKEKNQLLIRLKAMKFPVGQHVITQSNFALLAKVQRAIRTFGNPKVVVEGHTDSTGSDVTNERLSRLRAEEVREYFVANGTIAQDRITSVGYGATRPLAPNTSADGRAMNRRIDILIQPQSGVS